MDVYAQYRFLDPTIFGTSFSQFKGLYENVDIERTKHVNYTVLDRKEPYKNLGHLREKMFSIAFSMESDVKLPPVTRLVKRFQLSQKASAIYKQIKEEGALTYGENEVLEVNNVLTKIIRLQQVTSGYLALENLETKERRLKRIDKSRLEVLEGLLEGIARTEGVIVFAKFKKDLEGIHGLCDKMGIKYSELSGRENTLAEWKAGTSEVLGIQYKAGSEGITLVRARYCIYYSLTHSLSLYQQSLKRVHRPGQTRPVTYYHIVGQIPGIKTIDEDIVNCLKRKKNIIHDIMKKEG
jgi:SNF2 family DNA or RNA helicase